MRINPYSTPYSTVYSAMEKGPEKCGSIFRGNTLILVLFQWVETELE